MSKYKTGDLVALLKPDSCCGTTYELLAWEVTDVGHFRKGNGDRGVTLYEVSNGLETVYALEGSLKSVTG